ncbi:MAG: sigma-70 family RNA polymerase sigma factor [Candidatus Bipolaricaulia bacterium]
MTINIDIDRSRSRYNGKYNGQKTEELLHQLSESADVEIEQAIVKRNMDLIKSIVDRFSRAGENEDEDREELMEAGYIGLINAIYNFDPRTGIAFRPYAAQLIKSEIRYHLRNRDCHQDPDRLQIIRIPGQPRKPIWDVNS